MRWVENKWYVFSGKSLTDSSRFRRGDIPRAVVLDAGIRFPNQDQTNPTLVEGDVRVRKKTSFIELAMRNS